MNYKFKKIQFLLPFFILFGPAPLFAGEELSAEDVKSLVIGNTISATNLMKDFHFKVYFDSDGSTAFRSQGGEMTKTTYEFKGSKHCIYWKGKNRCANILKNDDGSYTRVNKKGKHVVQWTEIVEGNQL